MTVIIKKNVSRRTSPLESKGLQDAACRRTGLRGFGDPPLEPALSKLLDSLENEADLSPLGEGREPLWRASNWYSTNSKIKPARFSYGQQPDKSPPEIGGPGRFRIICGFSTGKLKLGL